MPAGCVVDGGNNKDVTVDNSAPQTDIAVSVNSQVDGGTKSEITCKNTGNETIASGKTEAKGDGTVNAKDLLPGEYTCTVVVDS